MLLTHGWKQGHILTRVLAVGSFDVMLWVSYVMQLSICAIDKPISMTISVGNLFCWFRFRRDWICHDVSCDKAITGSETTKSELLDCGVRIQGVMHTRTLLWCHNSDTNWMMLIMGWRMSMQSMATDGIRAMYTTVMGSNIRPPKSL